MAKRWKKEEITYLKRYARSRRLEELAERFNTDVDTVANQLVVLGITAKNSLEKVKLADDPLVKVYEKGVQAMHNGEWRTAKSQFQKVVAETDRAQLRSRARRLLAVCAERAAARSGDEGQAEDPFLQAVFERNRGNLEEALSICARGGRQSKDERFAYLAASVHALQGDEESALRFLSLAIEMEPKNRVHAFYDPDFARLRGHAEFARLFQIA
jgi:tetratricopeptide (TPR) repeat protein